MLYCYLIATILFQIWNARNLATFHNSCLPSQKVIDLIIRDIHFRIQCDTPDRVRHFWAHRNVVYSIDENDKLIMYL